MLIWMSEPADRVLPPLPDDEGSRFPRSPFAMLVVAGLVIATVFAAVAAFATSPQKQSQPLPFIPGPAKDSTTRVLPTGTTSVPTSAAPESSTSSQPTTTSSRKAINTTSTEQSTRQQAAPPHSPPPPPPPTAPVARFTFDCQLSGLSCRFDGTSSSDPDGSIIFYAWAFGDGGNAEGPRPGHTYDAPGSYTVTLLVMDNDGKTANLSRPVTVSSPR
jgi:chitodextrinase